MRRRDFIKSIAGSAATWPLAAHAQRSGKIPTIGFLGVVPPATWTPWVAVFVKRLHDLGWIEGRTVAIEYRWTEGRQDRLPGIAADFARLKPDVVVTAGPTAVDAVKQAMPTTPVVFALVGDPVGTGIVASLARPGGTVTGMSLLLPDTSSKRIEFLRQVVPGLRRLAIMANVNFSDARLHLIEVQQLGRKLGLELTSLEIRQPEDIAPAFESLQDRAQALYVCDDPLVASYRIRINTLAQGARLPTIYGLRVFVDGGGLLSYGPNIPVLFRRTAELVDKILRGARPADLPVEQPTKFDLVVNLTTAKALGITLPPSLLDQADEVIE